VGKDPEIAVPDTVEILDSGSFCQCVSIRRIWFGPDSKLCLIKHQTFETCEALQSMSIPPLVVSLGHRSLAGCTSLHSVSFEATSELGLIQVRAFDGSGVASIAIPASVELLRGCCFRGCEKQKIVTFAADSKLIRIEEAVFENCSSLLAICLPASAEYVGRSCFTGCHPMSNLTFSAPWRLRELRNLPPRWGCLNALPDSVEIPEWSTGVDKVEYRLQFGRESDLRLARTGVRRSLMRFSSRHSHCFD
jgi:hypothetical protein